MESQYPFLITLGCLLILTPLFKSIMNRSGIPPLVGYISLGFCVSFLNHQWHFISSSYNNSFNTLAQLGMVALLFRVGLKSHTHALLEKLPNASIIWLGDVLANLATGFTFSYYALSLPLDTSLVIAAAFSATSVAVSVSIWDEMNLLNTVKGQLLVDVAELDDLSGVLILAILLAIIPVLQSGNGDILTLAGTTTLLILLKLILFITGCYLFAHYLEADFTRLSRSIEDSNTAMAITILGAGLAIAAVAGYLGFSLAIGALFAGLAFSRDPEAVRTKAKFNSFYELFSPFFFIYIGMQVDPAAILPSLEIATLLLVPAVLAKFIGVSVPALRMLNWPDAASLGFSMIPRAEIAIVIVYQCYLLGGNIVPDNIFSAIVILSIMTSIISPLILRYTLARQS